MSARYQIITDTLGGVFDFTTQKRVFPDRSDPKWMEYQAWLTAGGEPMRDDPAGQLPLFDAQMRRCDEINLFAAGMRNTVIRGRSVGELASWVLKLLDALSVQSGIPSVFAPLLPLIGEMMAMPRVPASINDALAWVREITEAEHAGKVVTQAIPALIAETLIDGVRGWHCDKVLKMTDVREVVNYDWRTRWPVIPS